MLQPGKKDMISFSKLFKQLMANLFTGLPPSELQKAISIRSKLMNHHQEKFTKNMLNHRFNSLHDKLFNLYRMHIKELNEQIEASRDLIKVIDSSEHKSEDIIALKTCCQLNIDFCQIVLEFVHTNQFNAFTKWCNFSLTMDTLISSADNYMTHPFPESHQDPLGDKIWKKDGQSPKNLSESDKRLLFFLAKEGLKPESHILDVFDIESTVAKEEPSFEDYIESGAKIH